jgi:hypothetical protein
VRLTCIKQLLSKTNRYPTLCTGKWNCKDNGEYPRHYRQVWCLDYTNNSRRRG